MKTQSKWLKQTNKLNKAIKSKRIEQLKKTISDAEQQGMPANNMSLFLAKKQLFLSTYVDDFCMVGKRENTP